MIVIRHLLDAWTFDTTGNFSKVQGGGIGTAGMDGRLTLTMVISASWGKQVISGTSWRN
jgi:hypothetical protein